MKTTRYLLAASIAVAALTAGCSKQDNNYNVAADQLLPAKPAANVLVRLQVERQRPGYMFQWNTGSITTSDVVFNGVHLIGNMLNKQEFTAEAVRSIDIIRPSVTDLGTIAVPFDTYTHASIGIGLLGLKSANSMNLANSLYLDGYYYPVPPPGARSVTDPIPVKVSVNGPVVMNSKWLDQVLINKADYIATVSINVFGLTAGLDQRMLNAAEQVNGTIYINSTTNQDIYRIIVANLQDNIMPVQLSTPLNSIANYHAE